MLYHDNNYFGDPTRTNPFGWNATGTVFDRAGQQFRYRESDFFVWRPETGQVIKENYTLSIH